MAISSTAPAVGTVSLVGAGPGDPELLTLKGARLLREAESVFYDALANEALLAHCTPEAEKVFVGKRAGQSSPAQADITQQLIAAARAGKRVVRLKGGDSLLFARGAEEWEALTAAEVPVEVVPGITAALGASAALPEPLTDRRSSHAVTFLPGQLDPALDHPDASAPPLPWSRYAQAGETLVFYMAMRRLAAITAELQAAGRPADNPVTVVQWATTPRQRVLRSTLQDVAKASKAAGLGAPAVVIVAPVSERQLLPDSASGSAK